MRPRLLFIVLIGVWLVARPGAAQDPPPRIGPFVVDVHGTMPRFPADDQQLADSRGLELSELPGAGLGLHLLHDIKEIEAPAIVPTFQSFKCSEYCLAAGLRHDSSPHFARLKTVSPIVGNRPHYARTMPLKRFFRAP